MFFTDQKLTTDLYFHNKMCLCTQKLYTTVYQKIITLAQQLFETEYQYEVCLKSIQPY